VKAAITVNRPQAEVRSSWLSSDQRQEVEGTGATVRFADAPGDRGTEIQVELDPPRGGRVGELAQKLTGTEPLAKAKDELRRFKQLAETGVIARSEATPEGEHAERKLKQRPASPLQEGETEKASV
jgi:uncharacterized membrane protein